MLIRKNEQTLVEGHARHASEPAGGFGTADRSSAVPIQEAVQKHGRAEKLHGPSLTILEGLRKACVAELVEGRGDALFALDARAWCCNEACESSEVRLRMTYSLTIRHGQHTIRKRLQLWKCTGALIQWIHWALQAVVHCRWSVCLMWCNGLQRDAAHEARERFVLSTSLRGLSRVLVWTTFS